MYTSLKFSLNFTLINAYINNNIRLSNILLFFRYKYTKTNFTLGNAFLLQHYSRLSLLGFEWMSSRATENKKK